MSEVNTLVQQAISAYKANDKAKAKELLLKAVDLDEQNEQAWMWMSAVVDSLDEQQICLENVIQINPNNERASKGLAVLNEKLGKPAAPPPSATPAPAPAQGDNPWEGTGFDSSPFSTWDQPAADAAPAAAHGSGAAGDPTTGEQYDNWIDSLGISGGAPASEPADTAAPFTAQPANDDPWASLGNNAAPAPEQANPFVTDSSTSPDPWAQSESDASTSVGQQADPWGNTSGGASGSNPFSAETSGGDPWGTVTGVDPWATSSGQNAPASDPFGTSAGSNLPAEEEIPEEAERPTTGFEFAEDSESEPTYTSFDFDAVDEDEPEEYYISEDELQDDPFGDDDDLSDFNPFAGVDADASTVVVMKGSHYFQQIPEELRGSGGGSGRGSLPLVAILLLLNLAAAAGLVIG